MSIFFQPRTKLAPALAALLLLACGADPNGSSDPVRGQIDDGAAAQTELDPGALLPRRIRRLTNAEYGASLARLLGPLSKDPSADFAPDVRQQGFTVNDAQRVDPVFAAQVYGSAERLAHEARTRLAQRAPCNDAPDACARRFVQDFGGQAYRRALRDDEIGDLLEVYRAGAEGGRHEDGIELVVQAVLQSAGMLYLTELGSEPARDATAVLTGDEIASALSYLFTGGPPDPALREAAEQGALSTPAGRRMHAERLRATYPASTEQLVRIVHQWLELDAIDRLAKDTRIFPAYPRLHDQIAAEAHDFVARVLDERGAPHLANLLGADWSVVGPDLAAFYGATPLDDGRVRSPRRGLLNQAAFLSVQAHAHESSPVLRGALIARRIGCQNIPSPSVVKIEVFPPIPDPALTTRERFAAHATDLVCATCHTFIDGLGNAFENMDGMGAARTTENGRPIDSATRVTLDLDFDGAYADGNALAQALARSESAVACFARHAFQAASGRSGDDALASEEAFMAAFRDRPAARRGDVMEILLAYVESPLFTARRAP